MAGALVTALGLLLILEGLMPLIAPRVWRDTFERVLRFSNGQLRFFGLAFVLGGLLLLWM
jgi:uncharacterized protein YjeT (DUF2065 family)